MWLYDSYMNHSRENKMKKCENPNCENIVTEYTKYHPGRPVRLKKHCSEKCMRMHNSKKSREKTRQTCLERHGVENPFQSPVIKEQIKQTLLNLYGVEYITQAKEIQEQIKQTNLERHGVENVFQSPVIKEQIKHTCISKYGVENPSKSDTIIEKIIQTNITLHGTTSYTNKHIPIITQNTYNNLNWLIEQNETKSLTEMAHELNINSLILSRKFKEFNIPVKHHAKSFFEKQVYEYVKSIYQNIIQNDRTQIKPLELDIWFPDLNMAIECNGEYWHKEPEKEINKFNMCKEKGIDLHFIWYKDWKKDNDVIYKQIYQIIKNKIKQSVL